MPVMKSPYAQTVATTKGHAIAFEANEPTWVPPEIVSECLAVGVRHTDDEIPTAEPVAAQPEIEDNVSDEDELDAVDFEVGLDQALLRIITRADPADFKNDNTPKVNVVVAEMDPKLRRPTATEVSNAFHRLQENIDLKD